MEEKEYSKREVDLIVTGIKDHFAGIIGNLDKKVDLVIAQTTKTNGRVTRLEMWRSYLIGAFALAMIIIKIIK